MASCDIIFLTIIFKLIVFVSSSLKLFSQPCLLEDNNIGKCVPIIVCPTFSTASMEDVCEDGSVCCKVLDKIVTPDNPYTAPEVLPAPPIASSVPFSSASPAVFEISTMTSPGSVSDPPSTDLPNESESTEGSSSMESELTPVVGPDVQVPISQDPPALVGNIVTAPEMPSKSLPVPQPPYPTADDAIVISAEDIDNVTDIIDKKCDYYHSVLEAPPPKAETTQSLTPVVMIFGGTNTAEKEFPHMAALGFGEPNAKEWLCGGSLITENYILTAAHCLSASALGKVRYAKLGNTRLDQDSENTQEFNVINTIAHEQYDSRTQYNDIALIELDHTAQLTQYVMPICLFSSTEYGDKNLIATGWGKTQSGTISLNLQKVGLELFSQTECQNAYSTVSKQQLPQGIQESTQLCAGGRSESKDTCQGDSGGPLQIRKNNRWYLIGITSIGIQCGNVGSPGVYTRVAYFTQWIQEKVWNK